MQNFTVQRITKSQAASLIVPRHYSKRMPIFWHGFGLVRDGLLEGAVVYGQPSPPIQRHAFKDRDFPLLELARLVVQTDAPNAASHLIGRSLQMLAQPCAVVSYADSEYGHSGCVYQATNWLYTGATVSHDHLYLVDGKRTHPMTLRDSGITDPKRWALENDIATVKPSPKHRYFFLCGGKRERRDMLEKLRYPVVPEYPKAPRARYENGERLEIPLHAEPEMF